MNWAEFWKLFVSWVNFQTWLIFKKSKFYPVSAPFSKRRSKYAWILGKLGNIEIHTLQYLYTKNHFPIQKISFSNDPNFNSNISPLNVYFCLFDCFLNLLSKILYIKRILSFEKHFQIFWNIHSKNNFFFSFVLSSTMIFLMWF